MQTASRLMPEKQTRPAHAPHQPGVVTERLCGGGQAQHCVQGGEGLRAGLRVALTAALEASALVSSPKQAVSQVLGAARVEAALCAAGPCLTALREASDVSREAFLAEMAGFGVAEQDGAALLVASLPLKSQISLRFGSNLQVPLLSVTAPCEPSISAVCLALSRK